MQQRKRNPRNQKKKKVLTVSKGISSPNAPAIKYFDYYTSITSTTTVGFNKLTAIPQNVGQSSRLVDTVFVRRVDIIVISLGSTTDITNQIRFSIFNWIPNDASIAPGTQSVYEDPASWGVLTPLNYEGRRDYKVRIDKIVTLIGTSTAPTTLYQRTQRFCINKPFRIDFNIGSTTGLNHLYWTNFSDSVASPHPSYRIHSRVWFTDTY